MIYETQCLYPHMSKGKYMVGLQDRFKKQEKFEKTWKIESLVQESVRLWLAGMLLT